jgi:cephalosporin hydroxylase
MMAYLEDSLDIPLASILATMQNRIMVRTSYFGVKTLKNPLDFWVYQEIIHDVRPDVIIEIGNYRGGSALALAHLCDALGCGRVIAIDIDQREVGAIVREHPRITMIEGDAIAMAGRVRDLVGLHERVLVIEDSSHTYENTLGVLRAYGSLVSPGSYLIVEDSICHHGLDLGPNPGPFEAIEKFVQESPEFEIERERESFLITWNPKGFLRRLPADNGRAR